MSGFSQLHRLTGGNLPTFFLTYSPRKGTESIDAHGGSPADNTGHGGWRLRVDSATTKEAKEEEEEEAVEKITEKP